MVRTKATVRRLPVKSQQLPWWLVNREYGRKKTFYPFKIKETLPEQKSKSNQNYIWSNLIEWANNKNNKCLTKIEVF